MGVPRKKFVFRNGYYCGDLNEVQERQILDTVESDSIPKLKHMIYDFPADIIESADERGMRVLDYLKEQGIDPKQYWGTLSDKQTVGTGFLYLSPFSILGDGVGAGKTVEVAGLINLLRMTGQMKRVLFIADNNGQTQIMRQLKRFTGMRVEQVPSITAKLEKAIDNVDWENVEIMVGKHSLLTNDTFLDWLIRNSVKNGATKTVRNNLYDVFLLDESFILKNAQTITCTYVRKICEMARRIHFLNATVFETHIMDIYNQFDIMSKHIMPTKEAIKTEFCNITEETYYRKARFKGDSTQGKKSSISSYKNEADFKSRLKLVYLARPIKAMGIESNNKYFVAEVDPTEAQLKAMKKGYRYNEVLNDPTLIPDIGLETSSKYVPKLSKAVTLCTQDFADNNILIYCFHKNAQWVMKKELEAYGKTVGLINSDVKEKERTVLIDRFNRKELDILITSGKRASDLYGGDVCIMYSLEPNPAQMEQIRGRIDRHVDDREKVFVLMYYMFTPEYDLFNNAKTRSKDARNLTVDNESAVDLFMQAMMEGDIL